MGLPSLLEATTAYSEARQRVLGIHEQTLQGRATHLDLALAVKACAEAEATLQRVIAGYVPASPASKRQRPN
jgi:hypothetical protein